MNLRTTIKRWMLPQKTEALPVISPSKESAFLDYYERLEDGRDHDLVTWKALVLRHGWPDVRNPWKDQDQHPQLHPEILGWKDAEIMLGGIELFQEDVAKQAEQPTADKTSLNDLGGWELWWETQERNEDQQKTCAAWGVLLSHAKGSPGILKEEMHPDNWALIMQQILLYAVKYHPEEEALSWCERIIKEEWMPENQVRRIQKTIAQQQAERMQKMLQQHYEDRHEH